MLGETSSEKPVYLYATGPSCELLDIATLRSKVPPVAGVPRRYNVTETHSYPSRYAYLNGGDGPEDHRHRSRQWAGHDGKWRRPGATITLEERRRSGATFSVEWRGSRTTVALEVTLEN